MNDLNEQLTRAVQDGVREGVKSKLGGYGSPLDKLLADILDENAPKFRSILNEAISSATDSADFREELRKSLRHKLVTLLVSRFGGELEKQVNALKSDPATRARITLAIEEIVSSG